MSRFKPKLLYTLGGFVLLTASALLLWYVVSTPTDFPAAQAEGILIAHAGGGIDGQTYTDSREAVEASISKGFKFIELDLLLTTDNALVAGHDWKELNRLLGLSGEEPRNLAEVKERRILNKYTPLDAQGINDIFLKHPDVYLVTDKLDDFEQLTAQLTIPRNRLLVEVFSYTDYVKALLRGINYPMLCFWKKEKFDRLRYKLLFALGRIRMITIPAKIIPEAEKELSALLKSGVKIFAFSSDDVPFMQKYINKCVTGFYTDTISPSILQNSPPAD